MDKDRHENEIDRDGSADKENQADKIKGKLGKFFKRRNIIFSLLLLIIIFFAVRSLLSNSSSVLILSDMEEYQDSLKANSILVYYELAPYEFSGLDLPKEDLEEGKRHKKGEDIGPLSQEIKEKLESSVINNPDSPYHDYYQEVLEKEKITMPFSGLLYSQRDGYESIINPAILEDLAPGDINKDDFEISPQKGLRFIDNRIFYIAAEALDTDKTENWSLGSCYDIKIKDNIIVSGKLDRINKTDKGEAVLIFSFHDGIGKLIDKRFYQIEIIKKTYKAFRIPISACFYEDDIIYCYIQNVDNVVEKVKINVLDADNDKGEFLVEARSERENKEDSYLKQYDRLILSPDKVKEADIFK